MKWLTKPALLQQVPEPNKWLMAENELYQDNDGSIYLVPRMYKTDNYTSYLSGRIRKRENLVRSTTRDYVSKKISWM